MATSYNPQPVGLGRLQIGAVLRDAREPVLTPQGVVFAPNGAPPSRAVGVDVQPGEGAFFAGVGILFNNSTGRRRGLYRVDDNGGATYGLRFGPLGGGGFAVSAGVGADAAATAAAVLAALQGSAAFEAIGGEAEADPDDDTLIRFSVASTFVDRIWTGAAASLADNASAAVEASFARWRLWGLAKGQTGEADDRRWIVLEGAKTSRDFSLDATGIAGVARAYVEIIEADGFVIPVIAPAPREERAASLREAAATAFALVETAIPDFSTSLKGSSIASEVIAQGRVNVLSASTQIMPPRPDRRGFLIRNEGATAIQLSWRAAGVEAATATALTLGVGEIRAQSGEDCPRGALDGLSAASEPVWVEEW